MLDRVLQKYFEENLRFFVFLFVFVFVVVVVILV